MAFYLLVPVFVRLIRGCTSAFFCYVLALILRYLWVKTGYGDYMMIFYYLHYFLLGMLVWEIHQVGRRIGAQLLVYIGMIAAAGAVLTLGRAQTGFVYLVVVVLWHVTACRQRLSVLQEGNRRSDFGRCAVDGSVFV